MTNLGINLPNSTQSLGRDIWQFAGKQNKAKENTKEIYFHEILTSITTFLQSLTTASPALGLFDGVPTPCQCLRFLDRHFQYSCAVSPEGPSCLACPSPNTPGSFSWLRRLSWYKPPCCQRTNLCRRVYVKLCAFFLSQIEKHWAANWSRGLPHPH